MRLWWVCLAWRLLLLLRRVSHRGLLVRRHYGLRGIRELVGSLRILEPPAVAGHGRPGRASMRGGRGCRGGAVAKLLVAVLDVARLRIRDARRLVSWTLLGRIVAPVAHGHGVVGWSGGHFSATLLHRSSTESGGASCPYLLLTSRMADPAA
jgi:hypothetical protein